MPDRRKPVMNAQERAVDVALTKYAADYGYRVTIKMRLRDAIEIDDLPLTPRVRNFAWTSHLDFVFIDQTTHLPVLAVEYDGPSHNRPAQIDRDAIKDELCVENGLPLLRIDSQYARREGRWTVLAYILWAHELGKAYFDAQERGDIPWDEPFYHGSFIDTSGPQLTFFGLDVPSIRYLDKFRRQMDALWEASWWRATSAHVEARDILALPGHLYLSAHCAIRDFAIPGISALDIAEELSTAELGWLAKRYSAGDAVAIGEREARRLLDGEFKSWHLHRGWGRGPMSQGDADRK